MGKKDNFILAADIGGTNTRLGCFRTKGGKTPEYLVGTRFDSKGDYLSVQISQTLELAREQLGVNIENACFAVAGIINPAGDYAVLGNLEWGVDCKKLLTETHLKKIILLNDFEALGFGTNFLSEDNKKDLLTFPHPGGQYPVGNPKGTRAVIGPGTGLGHGILVKNAQHDLYFPVHSEGSHCDLAATNPLEWELVQFLRQSICKQTHPDYERVVSGPGIINIYNFLCIRGDIGSPLRKNIEKAPDKAAAITENIEKDPVCRQAIKLFLNFFARAAKNFALTCMATGGVYLGGGITPKILPIIGAETFTEIFEDTDRPTHREALQEIPVRVILNPQTALLGAAVWGCLGNNK